MVVAAARRQDRLRAQHGPRVHHDGGGASCSLIRHPQLLWDNTLAGEISLGRRRLRLRFPHPHALSSTASATWSCGVVLHFSSCLTSWTAILRGTPRLELCCTGFSRCCCASRRHPASPEPYQNLLYNGLHHHEPFARRPAHHVDPQARPSAAIVQPKQVLRDWALAEHGTHTNDRHPTLEVP